MGKDGWVIRNILALIMSWSMHHEEFAKIMAMES
jgi:hypothetical protein